MTLASWNGETGNLEEMRVPVTDRSFFFADAVYEVVRIYDGKLWLMKEHQQRLLNSLKCLSIEPDLEKISGWIRDLMDKAGVSEGILYFQISRGAGPRAHSPGPGLIPNFLGFIREYTQDPYLMQRKSGAAITLLPDQRWGRCDIKSTCLLPNVLAQGEAKKTGFDEAVLYDREKRVTEGSHSSVLMVKNQTIIAPPQGHHLLPGITRAWVQKLAGRLGFSFKEEWFSTRDLENAEEIFLAGTTTEVLPVTRIDQKQVAFGKPGPVTLTLQASYQKDYRQV